MFRYKAMTEAGALIGGEMDAPSEAAVVQHLRTLGHFPIAASDVNKNQWSTGLKRRFLRRRRASQRDLSIATQELATLLQAGLELDRALTIVASLEDTRALHEPLAAVLSRVRDGATLADALEGERCFPKLYVSMARAGELGGNLETTLTRLADYLARAFAIREAVASALVYPMILLGTAGLSIVVILVFVLPQFESLFAEAGSSLPLATRIVLASGDFLGRFGWLLLLSVAAALLWLRRSLERPDFKRRWDRSLLTLPLLGDLLKSVEMERFSRTLGTLLKNGVSLPVALAMTKETLSNAILSDAVAQAAVRLREGESLASELARSKLFPAMTLDLVRVGEESGKLADMLVRQADIYERNVKHRIDRLLALLVPVLTIVLGMVVAGLIASMLVAILSVNDLAL